MFLRNLIRYCSKIAVKSKIKSGFIGEKVFWVKFIYYMYVAIFCGVVAFALFIVFVSFGVIF